MGNEQISRWKSLWPQRRCPVIGMLHAPALPGSPRNRLSLAEITDFILRDAQSLAAGGVDGLMLENFGDVPFFPASVPPATVAQLTHLASEVRRSHPQLPLGINVLRNDGLSALAIAAAVEARFIRVNVLSGARVTDQGIVQGIAHDLLRERQRLAADHVLILADVAVKHSSDLGQFTLAEEAANLAERACADALIVTGIATGSATSLDDLREVERALPAVPVLVGSGITPENAANFRDLADGLIVGSSLKQHDRIENPIDLARTKSLVAAIGK